MGASQGGCYKIPIPGGRQLVARVEGSASRGNDSGKGQDRVYKAGVLGLSGNLRPAVVAPGPQDINFIVLVRAMLGDEKVASLRVPVHPLRVPVAVGVDVGVGKGI